MPLNIEKSDPNSEKPDPMDAFHLRLEQMKAEAARDYDAAMADLAKSHGEGEGEETRLLKLLKSMEPTVDRVLESDEGITPADHRTCERYLKTVELLGHVRSGRRLAYGAVAGDQPLGGAIGDPGHVPLERDDEA